MRMLKSSPAIGAGIHPNCEAFGYLLDANGRCAYIDAYNREVAAHPGEKKDEGAGQDLPVHPHAQLRPAGPAATTPTGSRTPRVQAGGRQLPLLTAEHVFRDYQFSWWTTPRRCSMRPTSCSSTP
jgi:nitronate monooxygenase